MFTYISFFTLKAEKVRIPEKNIRIPPSTRVDGPVLKNGIFSDSWWIPAFNRKYVIFHTKIVNSKLFNEGKWEGGGGYLQKKIFSYS